MKNLYLFSFVVLVSFSAYAEGEGDDSASVAAPAVMAQAPLVQSTEVHESDVAAPSVPLSRKRSLEGISESSDAKKVREPIVLSQQAPSTPRKTGSTAQSFMSPQASVVDADLLSPYSKSFKSFSPTRRALQDVKYRNGKGKSQVVRTPVKHAILDATFPDYLKENVVNYRGERIFLDETLYQLDQDFLTLVGSQYVWMSNRDRMALGHSPVGYKGYRAPQSRTTISQDKILKIQQRNTIELHHLDQREKGYGLVMLVPGLHRGMDSAYFIRIHHETGDVETLASGITREQRENFQKSETKTITQKIVVDALHSRQPNGSQINRDAFTKFRENFWKSLVRQSPSIVRTKSRFSDDDDGIAPTALSF